jgi:hypothetical protein
VGAEAEAEAVVEGVLSRQAELGLLALPELAEVEVLEPDAVVRQVVEVRGADVGGGERPPRIRLVAVAPPLRPLTTALEVAVQGVGSVPRRTACRSRAPRVAWLFPRL